MQSISIIIIISSSSWLAITNLSTFIWKCRRILASSFMIVSHFDLGSPGHTWQRCSCLLCQTLWHPMYGLPGTIRYLRHISKQPAYGVLNGVMDLNLCWSCTCSCAALISASVLYFSLVIYSLVQTHKKEVISFISYKNFEKFLLSEYKVTTRELLYGYIGFGNSELAKQHFKEHVQKWGWQKIIWLKSPATSSSNRHCSSAE